jgi:hypothetical protein
MSCGAVDAELLERSFLIIAIQQLAAITYGVCKDKGKRKIPWSGCFENM